MKLLTLCCLLLLACSLSFAQPPTLSKDAVVLIRDNHPQAKIYISPHDLEITEAPAPGKKPVIRNLLRAEIEDLNYHFERMSGARLEVVHTDDTTQVKSPALVIGTLATKLGATPPPTRWQEGFRIVSKNGQVLISGETPQATAHGIYTLLFQLGCDWVMPGTLGEIIPQRSTIAVAPQNTMDSPDFGMRRFWYRGGPSLVTKEERAEYEQWTRRQRLGVAEELKIYGSDHYWEQLIRKYKDRFEADPEMLALVREADGSLVRKGPQLESTNPKVVDLFVENIKATFTERGWPKDKKVTLPVGPSDGGGYSVSPESLAAGTNRTDPMMGGPDSTDLLVKLANDILDKIGDEYPNLSLGYLIYSVHADYPTRYKPNPRIYPVLAPISYSRLHSTLDPHSKSRAYYNRILKQWAALSKEQGNRLLVYEYNWNLADNMLPFTRVKMLGEEIPYYHKLGVSGFILESTKAWALNGAHDYIAARLVWDASQDWKTLLQEYSQKTFGNAAPMMEMYYLRLANIQSKAGQEAGSYWTAPLIFDKPYLTAAQKDLNAAMAQKLTPHERTRVQAAALPLDLLKHYLNWHMAMNSYDFPGAQKAFNALHTNWQRQLDLNPQFAAREVTGYTDRLLGDSTQEALKYSTGQYKIAYRFPDAVPTALDPTGLGQHMQFQAVETNDAHWLKTRTFGSTWDAQGLGFYRDGAIWYRVKFRLPSSTANQPVGLYLGGFDDEAVVWLNGKPLGSSGRKFSRPAIFDLTDGIMRQGENLLAIQVKRNSNLNENLTGGLMRPSFVFTGPRVATSNNPRDAQYRILPGGELQQIR